MSLWQVENISVQRQGQDLVTQACFSVEAGECVALIGPNGAGKTTLIRAGLGLITATAGRAFLSATPLEDLSRIERARIAAYLPQSRPLAWPVRVQDIVALGRYAYGANLNRLGSADRQAVEKALDACDLTEFAGRSVDTLSGGEVARLHCARAFASGAPLLIADEPAAGLDPYYQLRVLDLIKAHTAKGGSALIVLHDLGLAARYADTLIWMKAGKIDRIGTPEATMTQRRLAEIFNIEAHYDQGHLYIEHARNSAIPQASII